MLSSIGLTQGVVIQGWALLIDIGLALVLSLLYQRALELSAPEVALIDQVPGKGRAHRTDFRSPKPGSRSMAWYNWHD